MRQSTACTYMFLACTGLLALPLKATISVQLGHSQSSPQLVGTPIKWSAGATDSNPNPVTYKFEVAPSPFTTYYLLQDFSLGQIFTWVETYVEGSYQIRVTARDYLSGETAQAVSGPFQINSRVTGSQPVVSATGNPLVALYSAPTCADGSTMRVSIQRAGASAVSYTDYRPCHPGSMNFYIAGMSPTSTYNLNYMVKTNGSIIRGSPVLQFTTGSISSSYTIPTRTLVVPAGSATDQPYKISLSSYAKPAPPFAADLTGSVVWYCPYYGQLMRTLGQTILLNADGSGTGTGPFGTQTRQQSLKELDLAGNIIRATNADRISEQLVGMGTDSVGRFNHDAIRLPNGHTIALVDVQRAFPAGTQGSAVPLDIIAEIIVELDENFQVIWFWNAFDHDGGGTQLDINRASLEPGTCSIGANGQTPIGCPPGLLPGFTSAQDWLHANAVQLLADGNLILSLRNQDWIIKIDYENGAVPDGSILWRMGNLGDFQIVSSDSFPWFSGQHEPGFSSPTALAVFDNGNTRVIQNGSGNSRGMAFAVDETAMTVTTTLSADLGVFSDSQGSAQLLPNGNYHFQPGHVAHSFMQSLEVTPTVPNTTVFNMQVQAESYRTFRMPDMYTPPYGTAASTVTH